MDMFNAVKDFHVKFNLPVSETPNIPDDADLRALRRKLMREEYLEYTEAELDHNDLEKIARELADIIYIACGTACVYGIPLDKVFGEVHRSNMDKLGADGKPVYREDGKVLKPEGWVAPNIKKVLYGE